MKKEIKNIMFALPLLALLGACSGGHETPGDTFSAAAPEGGITTPTPEVGVTAPAPTPGAEAPTPKAPVGDGKFEFAPPITGEAKSALNGIISIDSRHKQYAEYTGASELGVKMVWQEKMKKTPLSEIANNFMSINSFLDFVYHVDPMVRDQLNYANAQSQNSHQYMAAFNNTQLGFSIKYLTGNNNMVKERILKAAEIYGVALRNFSGTKEDPMFPNLSSAMNSFTSPIFAGTKFYYSLPAGEETLNWMAKFNLLLESFTFVAKHIDGSEYLVSFENFSGSASVFTFTNDDRKALGGFQAMDPSSVQFEVAVEKGFDSDVHAVGVKDDGERS